MASKKLTRRTSKIRPVPINQMVVPPALQTQRPFIPSLGDAIAKALDLNMLGYPIINHRDGKYLVVDGQHRIYALKVNGFENDVVDCEVYEDLTDEEMAQIFLGRDRRKAISPFVKFHISCTAGHERELAIRRVVEANGCTISRSSSENSISAVSTLIKIYDNSPQRDTAVGWCVRIAKSGFSGDPRAFDATVLDALGLFRNRYNGKPIETTLIKQLAGLTHGVTWVFRRSEWWRQKTGKSKADCLVKVLVEVYNKGVAGNGRLAPWWKETEEKVA